MHEPCITVNQANRMPLHIQLVASGVSGLPVTVRCPRESSGLSAPKRKAGSRNPDAVLVNSGSVRITTARLLYIGRMLSASTVPPGSGPCHPSTPRRPVCRSQHPAGLPPLEPFAPQGAGSLLLLGARLARGGAPEEEGTGLCPVPPYSARDFSRRIPASNRSAIVQRPFCIPTVFPKRAPSGALTPTVVRVRQSCPHWGRRYTASRN